MASSLRTVMRPILGWVGPHAHGSQLSELMSWLRSWLAATGFAETSL